MKLRSPLASCSLPPALLLGLVLGGCMTGKSSIGELPGAEGSSSGSPTDDEGSTATTSATPDPTTGAATDDGTDGSGSSSGSGEPPFACPPTSQCTLPLECEPEGFETCGGIIDRSDENGCPRQPCSGPGECPAGHTCYLPWGWSDCGRHTCYDLPDSGLCECGFGLDCNNNGLCVPEAEGLPPDTDGPTFCGQHTDAASCEGSLAPELGYCLWYEGWQMQAGAACEERVEVSECVFAKRRGHHSPLPSCDSDPTLTPIVRNQDGLLTVLLLGEDDPQPTYVETSTVSWSDCEWLGVEAECQCGCP